VEDQGRERLVRGRRERPRAFIADVVVGKVQARNSTSGGGGIAASVAPKMTP
jgi:hypothetical protein